MRCVLSVLFFLTTAITARAQLSLLVNTDTGVVEVLNQSQETYSWNYYEIRSQAGSLNLSGWFSFDDQNFDATDGPDPGSTRGDSIGEGWDEAPNSNSNVMAELFLTGSTTAAPNNLYFLGVPFTPNAARDLEFNFGLTDGRLLDGLVVYTPELPDVDTDFDDDGDSDCGDVDALVAAIVDMGNNGNFDLNGDGQVDVGDLDQWRVDAGAINLASGGTYLKGDANLDGIVDISDFNIWNANKFTTNPSWCSADFNASGTIDISDFNLWNANKFQASDTAVVPEPSASVLVMLCAIGGLFWTREGR
ncbi:MAG: hypothetical protein AAF497_21565 [Planctomycetota bacterium]